MKTMIALFAVLFSLQLNVNANGKATKTNEPADSIEYIAGTTDVIKHVYSEEFNTWIEMRYINDDELPLKVISKLMKKVPNADFVSIVELNVEGIKTYIITLEDTNTYKVVRCGDKGQFGILQSLQKQ
ncbi:hypothetical protein COR50_09560 [Chitinophaga caeni]|uniref:Beta-lactamase-inhibitor-like PepSY-like domain-containing protein n=1 Tax=Chitinophaga caeni TaxID=2029983 RepID=A0A291QTX9_9BACT|nr:hypothetical protein [Chitinophaga caeni]ATL47396.1 hypothetical protein COR50_09560 [Chitinophaga caeni]